MKKRYGDFIQTYSGIKFYPFDPKIEEIKLCDIIHALSFICRFVGHSQYFYSVAQHSVLVAEKCPKPYKMYGLLHDAAEAYISDIAHPIKRNKMFQPVRELENNLLDLIFKNFNVVRTKESDEIIKNIDKRMLYTEKNFLMKDNIPWGKNNENAYQPFDDIKIIPWDPEKSQLEFYKLFSELYF